MHTGKIIMPIYFAHCGSFGRSRAFTLNVLFFYVRQGTLLYILVLESIIRVVSVSKFQVFVAE